MKITNDPIKNPAGLVTEKVEPGAGKKTEKSQVQPKATENVTLSPMAAQLQSLEAKVAADNVFDIEKVDAIKSAIASGQFKVDSEKVADGLIETVKDLLTPKKT
ncbi:MAG TPA: flagellar biosynthesis anti-sigma factor FlgM [Methylophilaceae bacterium]|nr:flagellar biosynthesis anti-sigma factor FlgM [Methylophilaceae bacterium]HSI28987.1 flagellar biosynthesis anti-sigma factor FlgM [Methylophilus sp.]